MGFFHTTFFLPLANLDFFSCHTHWARSTARLACNYMHPGIRVLSSHLAVSKQDAQWHFFQSQGRHKFSLVFETSISLLSLYEIISLIISFSLRKLG